MLIYVIKRNLLSCSFSQHLQSAHYVPDTVLDSGNTNVKKTSSSSHSTEIGDQTINCNTEGRAL